MQRIIDYTLETLNNSKGYNTHKFKSKELNAINANNCNLHTSDCQVSLDIKKIENTKKNTIEKKATNSNYNQKTHTTSSNVLNKYNVKASHYNNINSLDEFEIIKTIKIFLNRIMDEHDQK